MTNIENLNSVIMYYFYIFLVSYLNSFKPLSLTLYGPH